MKNTMADINKIKSCVATLTLTSQSQLYCQKQYAQKFEIAVLQQPSELH